MQHVFNMSRHYVSYYHCFKTLCVGIGRKSENIEILQCKSDTPLYSVLFFNKKLSYGGINELVISCHIMSYRTLKPP